MVSDDCQTHVQGPQRVTRHKSCVETEICKGSREHDEEREDRLGGKGQVNTDSRKTRLLLDEGMTDSCGHDSRATILIQHKTQTAEMQVGSTLVD